MEEDDDDFFFVLASVAAAAVVGVAGAPPASATRTAVFLEGSAPSSDSDCFLVVAAVVFSWNERAASYATSAPTTPTRPF